MRSRLGLLGVAVLVALLLPSLFGHLGSAVGGLAPRPNASAASAELSPAVAPRPSASCGTPPSTGVWGSTDANGQPDFYKSVKVQFYVPNDPAISGSNFNLTPCPNVIPTYDNGFWMNISTDVQIAEANVTIWGTSWSLPNQAFATPIPNFSPGEPYNNYPPTSVDMLVNPPLFQSASFYFNDYKNFWPGSQVFFNLTVTVINASPAQLRSADTGSPAVNPVGTSDKPSWQFSVQSPWTSNNFSNDIQISTIPDVLGNPVYAPNPNQPFQIVISAINVGTGTTLSIPAAQLTLSVCQGDCVHGTASTYIANFGPTNHSVETIVDAKTGQPRTLGPFQPGSNISFNISAWVPWEGGIIDRIYSPLVNFTWSTKGGWWAPNAPLEDNLELSTSVVGLNATPVALPTMTPVNVTIHEPIQNVTIGSATVNFQYHDRYGSFQGGIPMTPMDLNTSYLLIPGLPAGGNLTFSVLAKDIKGNTVASSNYSYYETGDLAVPPAASTGFLFFEAVDLSTGSLYSRVPFTISNSTWSESGNISVFGFGGVRPPAGLGFLPLAYGSYTLTVTANGVTRTAGITVDQPVATPTVFYFASQPVASLGTVEAATFPLSAAIGILAAAVVAFPIYAWFKERRRKAEAEQKRITL